MVTKKITAYTSTLHTLLIDQQWSSKALFFLDNNDENVSPKMKRFKIWEKRLLENHS